MPQPKPVLTTYEQEILRAGTMHHGILFGHEHLHQLYRLRNRLNTPMFEVDYQGIRFGNIVGVIQLPQLLIEVLPKINQQITDEQLRITWTKLLQNSGYLPSLGDINPQLLTQPASLLGILVKAYLTEIELLIQKGLIKQYQTKEANLYYLRGKLELSRQLRHNLIRKDRFYVRTQTHQLDHLLHQRLKQALRIVQYTGNSKHSAAYLLSQFREVSNIPLDQPWEDLPPLNLLTSSYRKALSLAKLICQGFLGGTFVGSDYGFTLAYSMPQVFEKLILRHLSVLAKQKGWELHYQPIQRFWQSKTLRPDFLLHIPGRMRIVIDAKWKILKRAEPNDEDLRQIFAYTQIFQAQRGILLYPDVYQLNSAHQLFSQSVGQPASCEIQFISLQNSIRQQLKSLLSQ